MRVAFDVDGCLIDSRELVIAAYGDAGVLAPTNVLECEGVDWLAARGYTPQEVLTIKALKNEHYLRRLARGDAATLPPYDVACRLAAGGYTCDAYTAAPHGTIETLEQLLPCWPFASALDKITTAERMTLLRRTARAHGMLPRGDTRANVYVDDQRRIAEMLLPKHWRIVHYVGQDADELYHQIDDR